MSNIEWIKVRELLYTFQRLGLINDFICKGRGYNYFEFGDIIIK